MAHTAKLMNPTPFEVDLPWDRGVSIVLEPFGHAELSMQQMDDFRPGKPGSAAVNEVLNYHGLFLLDADRPYDNQALEALRRAHASKKAQYDATIRNITDRRAASGVAPNEEALAETLTQMGYTELGRKVSVLAEAIKKFQEVVGSQPEVAAHKQLDPKRTIFVLDPPRQFPSVAAMEFFLTENPEVEVKHQALNEQAAGVSQTPSRSIESIQRFVNESNDQPPMESMETC